MGLLDDFFGKEEINQLKKQLIEKTNEVTRLESHLSKLNSSQLAHEQQVAQLEKTVADGSAFHNVLDIELAQTRAFLHNVATDVLNGTPEQMLAMLREDGERWARYVKLARIEPQ